jgi:hypothetical protein
VAWSQLSPEASQPLLAFFFFSFAEENLTSSVMDLDTGKPLCGGGQQAGEYDLGIHVAGLCTSKRDELKKEKRKKREIFQLTGLGSPGSVFLSPWSWLPGCGEEGQMDQGADKGLLHVQALWNWRVDRDSLCTCKRT